MADVTINSIPDLLAFASGQYGYGSSSDYLDVELGADLDFAEYDNTYNFSGCYGNWYLNFDGKGHKIDNIQYTGSAPWGFIRGGNGHVNTIKNLTLTNMYIVSGDCAAGLYTCQPYVSGATSILNCHISGQIESYGSTTDVSGVCYDRPNPVTISYCSFSGMLKNVGGSLYSMLSNSSEQRGRIVNNCMGICDMQTISGFPFGISGWPSTAVNSEYRGSMKVSSGASNFFPFNHGGGGKAYNCICVINGDSIGGIHNDANTGNAINSYIDGDELAIAGISLPSSFVSATTANLKSAGWLREHGFPI